ncbi:MAG TPA: hypothetical protein VFH42_02455 [Sporolactobacillaceae bacterium]|nr:hypothetical protein [Sporolactobacillaceae bacterium]
MNEQILRTCLYVSRGPTQQILNGIEGSSEKTSHLIARKGI